MGAHECDRGVGSGPDLRQRRVDRYVVRRAGAGREHRRDPRSGGFDPRDGRVGTGRAERRDLWRPVPDRAGRLPVSRHPLLEAAIDALPPPADLAVEVTVRSVVPAGCGAGTSAAVAVALLGALAAARAEQLSPRDVAYAAHRLEVDVLGDESGIQDQLSAAFGGINYLEIDRYPNATVQSLPVWDELGARLTLVFLGRPMIRLTCIAR